MERTAWTDLRIDDMVAGIDHRFDQMDARFVQLERRMERLEVRMERLEARMDDLYRQIFNFALVQFVALLSILATVIVRT